MNIIEKIKSFDKIIISCVLFLVALGVIAISSASRANITGDYSLVIKQIIWFVLGTVAMMIISTYDFSKFGENFSVFGAMGLYLVNIVMLTAVLIAGAVRKGSGRWISIGGFNAQPSEFAKVIMIVCLAVFIAKQGKSINNLINVIINVILILIPTGLILMQPDLSTSIIFIVIFISQMFIANINYKYIIGGVLIGLLGVGVIFADANRYSAGKESFFLKDYQARRVLALFNPEKYAKQEAYQTKKSVQAIGSGRLYGKGIYKGNLNKADYLPEPHTDFIFSIIAEESGFLMAILILLVYGIIIVRCIVVAMNSNSILAQLVITGIISMLAFQVFINIGVVTVILPSTGIPLPFISYGGSSMLTNMIAIGIVLNIDLIRKKRYYLI